MFVGVKTEFIVLPDQPIANSIAHAREDTVARRCSAVITSFLSVLSGEQSTC
ncbi:mCG1041615 [Mus musculus]|nr:mCG1041615 [Mus musculus]